MREVRWDGGALPCETLLLHEGVIPSTHVTRALGLEHRWDAAQRCWRPVLDGWGATSHDRIAVAGDGGGIGGWEAAVASGRLAQLLPDFEPLQLGMYGVYASRKHMPATLRTMLDFLAQRFAGQPF